MLLPPIMIIIIIGGKSMIFTQISNNRTDDNKSLRLTEVLPTLPPGRLPALLRELSAKEALSSASAASAWDFRSFD